MRFNPEGDVIASGSHDKHIFLWRTYGDCENFMMLKGAGAAGQAGRAGAAAHGDWCANAAPSELAATAAAAAIAAGAAAAARYST